MLMRPPALGGAPYRQRVSSASHAERRRGPTTRAAAGRRCQSAEPRADQLPLPAAVGQVLNSIKCIVFNSIEKSNKRWTR